VYSYLNLKDFQNSVSVISSSIIGLNSINYNFCISFSIALYFFSVFLSLFLLEYDIVSTIWTIEISIKTYKGAEKAGEAEEGDSLS
jgi:hypothetical protein